MHKFETIDQVYDILKNDLSSLAKKHNLYEKTISVRVRALSAEEAIGNPEDKDYPIIFGREKMIQAYFGKSKGQAFTDEYGEANLTVKELIAKELTTNKERAYFIAAFNAIYRHLGFCDKTIHCKDEDPVRCGQELLKNLPPREKILLVGLQPRLLQSLVEDGREVRVLDLDKENIGTERYSVTIEGPAQTENGIQWCDRILATGSTIVNGSITTFLNQNKPILFFGVTISAPAKVLGLDVFCSEGK
ncbi:MAG: Rossmann-like domain-containing protein [Bacteriovoracia bacterium]